MRSTILTILLSCAIIFVMAGTNVPFFKKKKKDVAPKDSIELRDSVMRDSTGKVVVDTTSMDSLQLAVYHHNQQVDDSIRLDSINRRKSNGINSPVTYTAQKVTVS